jgi:RNA polymerase sigma factor (sigma-70 family)
MPGGGVCVRRWLLYRKKPQETGLPLKRPPVFSQPPTDAELWAAFQRGDERAFRHLYHAHFRHLLNYGLRFYGTVAVVEDAIQELFLELWQYRLRLTQPDSVRFYLLKGLRNRLSAQLRRERAFDRESLDEALYPFALEPSSEQRWIDLDADEDLRQRIRYALDQLSPRQREFLYLRYFNDLTYDQLCDLLGVQYQTARSQVYQALKVLRQRLGPEFFAALAAVVWKT